MSLRSWSPFRSGNPGVTQFVLSGSRFQVRIPVVLASHTVSLARPELMSFSTCLDSQPCYCSEPGRAAGKPC